jgi:hypothetical protein
MQSRVGLSIDGLHFGSHFVFALPSTLFLFETVNLFGDAVLLSFTLLHSCLGTVSSKFTLICTVSSVPILFHF